VLVIGLTFPDFYSLLELLLDHVRLGKCKQNATISVTSFQNRSEARAPIARHRRVETLLLVWPFNCIERSS
jgi:hypothetical protein